MPDEQLISERPPAPIIGPGTMLDRYELVCKLADGGMASVWIARQRGKHGFEKLVAVKTILPEYFGDDPFRRMFLDEARISARIDHTNVAKILDLGEDGQVLYLAMEWVEGDMLVKLQRLAATAATSSSSSSAQNKKEKDHSFPTNVYLRIIADACAGLHAAHELTDIDGTRLEVVHRDVSPQNILVSREGHAKVIDFGIARANNRLSDATSFGIIKGKVQFMAPEQARGEKTVDRTADIWAVGAILYQFFAKRPVHAGDSEVAMMMKLVVKTAIDPLPNDTPKPIRDVVMRALVFKPGDRFTTMADLRSGLEEAMVATGCVATTVDVAAFVNEVAGARVTARREKVRKALRALDEDAHHTKEEEEHQTAAAASQPVPSHDVANGDNGSELRAKSVVVEEMTSLPPTNTAEATTPTTNTATTTTNITSEAAPHTVASHRSSARWVGVSAAIVVVLLGVAAFGRSGVWRRQGVVVARSPASTSPAPNTMSGTTSESALPANNPSSPIATTTPQPLVDRETPFPAAKTAVVATNAALSKTSTRAPTTRTTTTTTTTAQATPSITPDPVASTPPPPPPAPVAALPGAGLAAPTPANPVVRGMIPAIDPKRARVSISGVQNEHGVRRHDVQSALMRTVGAMTECYQAELARTGRHEGGFGTIRIETDGSGRIVRATASIPFSSTVARCIERSVSGMVVPGVDTGEAVASVLIALSPN